MNKMKKFIFELLTFCVVLFAVYAYSKPLNNLDYSDYSEDLWRFAMKDNAFDNARLSNFTRNIDESGSFLSKADEEATSDACPNIYTGFSSSTNEADNANGGKNKQKDGEEEQEQDWLSYIKYKVWKRENEQKLKRRRIKAHKLKDDDMEAEDNEAEMTNKASTATGEYCAAPQATNADDKHANSADDEQDNCDIGMQEPEDENTPNLDQSKQHENDNKDYAEHTEDDDKQANVADRARKSQSMQKYLEDTLNLKKMRLQKNPNADKKRHKEFEQPICTHATFQENSLKTLKHGGNSDVDVAASCENVDDKDSSLLANKNENHKTSRYIKKLLDLQNVLDEEPKGLENMKGVPEEVRQEKLNSYYANGHEAERLNSIDLANLMQKYSPKNTNCNTCTKSLDALAANKDAAEHATAVQVDADDADTADANTDAESASAESADCESANHPDVVDEANSNEPNAEVVEAEIPANERKDKQYLIDIKLQQISQYLNDMEALQKIAKKEAEFFDAFKKVQLLENSAQTKLERITKQPAKTDADEEENDAEDDNNDNDNDDDDKLSEEQKIRKLYFPKTYPKVSTKDDTGLMSLTGDIDNPTKQNKNLETIRKNTEEVALMLHDIDAERGQAASEEQQAPGIRYPATTHSTKSISAKEQLTPIEQNTYPEETTADGKQMDNDLSALSTGNEAVQFKSEIAKAVNNILGEFQNDFKTADMVNAAAAAADQTAGSSKQIKGKNDAKAVGKEQQQKEQQLQKEQQQLKGQQQVKKNDDDDNDDEDDGDDDDQPVETTTSAKSVLADGNAKKSEEKDSSKAWQSKGLSNEIVDIRVLPEAQQTDNYAFDEAYDNDLMTTNTRRVTKSDVKSKVENSRKSNEETNTKAENVEENETMEKSEHKQDSAKSAEQQVKNQEDSTKSEAQITKNKEDSAIKENGDQPDNTIAKLKPEKETSYKEDIEAATNYDKTLEKVAQAIKNLQEQQKHLKNLSKPPKLSKADDAKEQTDRNEEKEKATVSEDEEASKKSGAKVVAKEDEDKAHSIEDGKGKDSYAGVHEDEHNKNNKKHTDDNNENVSSKSETQQGNEKEKSADIQSTAKPKEEQKAQVPSSKILSDKATEQKEQQTAKPKEEQKAHVPSSKMLSDKARKQKEQQAQQAQQEEVSVVDRYLQELENRDKFLLNEVGKAVSNVISEFQNKIDSNIKRNDHRTAPRPIANTATITAKINDMHKEQKAEKEHMLNDTLQLKLANWKEQEHYNYIQEVNKYLSAAKNALNTYFDDRENFFQNHREEIKKMSQLDKLEKQLEQQDEMALSQEVHKAVNNVISDLGQKKFGLKTPLSPPNDESIYSKIWNFFSNKPKLVDGKLQAQVNDVVNNVVVKVQDKIDEAMQGYEDVNNKAIAVVTAINTAQKEHLPAEKRPPTTKLQPSVKAAGDQKAANRKSRHFTLKDFFKKGRPKQLLHNIGKSHMTKNLQHTAAKVGGENSAANSVRHAEDYTQEFDSLDAAHLNPTDDDDLFSGF